MRGRILVVDDDRQLIDVMVRGLGRRDFEVTGTTAPSSALDDLTGLDPDAIVTDLRMPGLDGLELCRRVAERRPDLPVLVLTAFGTMDTAVEAIRAGAYDFLSKPVDVDALVLALDRAVAHRRLKAEVRRLRAASRQADRHHELVGDSEPMKRLFDQLRRVAPTGSSVLIHGESGTGKELVARALHDGSPRASKPFVAINCAAVPEHLLESELFGHVKGAFTDARGARAGLFVRAGGGTLFLDELGDLPASLQAKLLRVLQERRVRPVGSDDEVAVDVRVVSATHRDLEAAAGAGTFRSDLLYRLDVIRLEVPPLRARGNDVLVLAQRFVEHHARRAGKEVTGLSGQAARKLVEYDWPGNVRELQNAIERAVALTAYDRIGVDDLPPRIAQVQAGPAPAVPDDPLSLPTLDEVERRHILRVLSVTAGNKAEAARILGLDRKTLYRKLERWGIPPQRDTP